MRATNSFQELRAYVVFFLLVLVSMVSCKPDILPPDPPAPAYTKAVVAIRSAEKITATTATMVARVVPNENGTSVSFEYKTTGSNWTTVTLPTTFSGKDSVTVTSDISALNSGTEYIFRAKASNKGGETVSYESKFTTRSYVRPAVAIKPAEKVKLTSATVVAKVVPNENDTQVSFEYKTTDTDWAIKNLPLTFNGKDSVSVTFDLSDLKLGTVYSFRVRAKNVGGEAVSSESKFETYSVSDFDGNLYHTVTIGTQTWLKENFRGVHYANGDPIANVTDPTAWSNLTTGAYCWYNNDPKIGEVYGGLYNFYVGSDSRGLISGWHVPTMTEWNTLYLYLGQYQAAGPKMMEVGLTHWKQTIVPATNTSGFTALPNGLFNLDNTTNKFTFVGLGEIAIFWSSSLFGPGAVVEYIEGKTCFFSNGVDSQKISLGLRLTRN